MKASLSTWTARRSVPGVVLILALGVWLPACSAQDKAAGQNAAQGGNRELARVNGKVITEADVQATAKDAFAQLDRQYQQQRRELLEGTLNQAVQNRLVEAEAAAKLAVALLKGEKPATDGTVHDPQGKRDVPSVLLMPISIFKDDIKRVLADGFVKKEDLCKGAYASKCEEAGL